MKAVLFYFSGTGNSLAVARALAQQLGDTEVLSMARAIHDPGVIGADHVGLVFPVYMFGLPLIVARFCRKLRTQPSAYVFGIATNGGMPGGTLFQLKRVLRERGIALSAGFSIQMPGNYTPLAGAPAREKQEKMFAKAKERIREIAGIVKARRQGGIEAGNFIVNGLFSGLLYRMGAPRISAADKDFWVNDKCNGCGVCVKVCPVGNIGMREDRPCWLHRCEQCMACLQWCPEEALQFGRRTEMRQRYRHPDVSVNDFMMKP